MTPFKEGKEGQTHYAGDGCDPPHEPVKREENNYKRIDIDKLRKEKYESPDE